MRKSLRISIRILALLLLGSAAVQFPTATAQDQSGQKVAWGSERSTTAPRQFCAFSSSTGRSGCFGSAEAAAAAMRAPSPNVEIVQAKFYEDTKSRGDVFTIYGDGLCDDDPDRDFRFTFPPRWRERISSFQPWADCTIWVHRKPYLHGKRVGPFWFSVPFLKKSLNDRIQSVAFR